MSPAARRGVRILTDTERINELERAHAASGLPFVVMRDSTLGRGMRLHSVPAYEVEGYQEQGFECSRTVREAIDRYVFGPQIGPDYKPDHS